jgi:hypothetical protein
MNFEAFLTTRLDSRLHHRRLLVVYDPDRRFRDIVLQMGDAKTTVLDCDRDLLEAREAALEGFVELGRDSSFRKRLVLYVATEKPLEDADRCLDPFSAFVEAGACFPDGAADEYRQLCLQFLPEQSGRIEEMFASGEAPTIQTINGLRSGAVDSPVLRELLEAEGPKDMLVKFLAAGPATVEQLRSTTHWVRDLKDLVSRTLGFKLEGPKESVEDLQSALWRFLLFSEFAVDLPEPLPARLTGLPHAGNMHHPFVRSLCTSLRDLISTQPAYEEAAARVARELDLESACAGIQDFGALDTFSFEERGFLRRFAKTLLAGQFEDAREIVNRRQGSFWVERDARRSAEWQLADLAAKLMLDLQDVAGELAGKKSLDEWIDLYTQSFARIDTVHRAMEQVAAEISPIESHLADVLDHARGVHHAACDTFARAMQDEVAKTGWPSTTKGRASDIFDRWVEGPWKEGERIVYFWIDALRYELALSLESSLAEQHDSRVEVVCGNLPGLTAVGMAALLPGASTRLTVEVREGKPVALVGSKVIDGPKARAEVLAAHVGANRTRMLDLEDVAGGKLPEDIDLIEVLAVKTTDIDSLGENNPGYFIGMLPGILRKIQLAMNHLAKAGFQRAIVATDHGFCWMKATSAGNAISKPGGEWVATKDRVLLGSGTADTNSHVLETADLGIRTAIPRIAFPKGIATYEAGVTYFHGGLSPQECILPVIDVRLKLPQAPDKTHRVDITLTYRGASKGTITTLMPTLELAYPADDLFGPSSVRLLLQAVDRSGQMIGEAAPSASVDPASREVVLERGKAIKVPLRIHEGFEGEFKVTAIDPQTAVPYAVLKLETEFHH